MTHDELIRMLLVERYSPQPKRQHAEDTEDQQARRRRSAAKSPTSEGTP